MSISSLSSIGRWYPVREAAASFVPAVDIFENGEKVVLKLDVPGVKEENLDIRMENQVLTVRGERKFEAEEKEENGQRTVHLVGRSYGSFTRSFTLPTSVDTENVQASYEAGVLKLELRKKASAQPRQIKIGGAETTVKPVENQAANAA